MSGRARILVVEDEPDLLRITVYRLEKAGYEVATAIDGRAALEAVRRGDFDLILLDLNLPVIDGAEVCRMLKAADSAHRHIPVIAFTATVNKIKETYGILGADDYVIKPFDIGELLEKIARLMAGRGGEQSGQP